MEKPFTNPLALEWLVKADADYVTANRELRARKMPNYDAACFHAQQCVEKLLKSMMIHQGIVPPRSHDLSYLLSLILPRRPKALIQRFLERDIPQLGITISSTHLRRFWSMLAHYHGQTWNAAEIGGSLGVSGHTMRHYLDILCETFMVRQLPAWNENVAKRQIKAPKIFFRDSGIFHSLVGISDFAALLKNPKIGASWEGYAVEEVLRKLSPRESYSWGVHNGPSLDLMCFKDGQRMGFEIKYQDAPRLSRSMVAALEILKLDQLKIVYPGKMRYSLQDKIEVVPLEQWLLE